MACEFFSGLISITHTIDEFTNFISSDDDRLESNGIGMTLQKKVNNPVPDPSQVINKRYPLDGVILSPPLLVNYETFNDQNPNDFLTTTFDNITSHATVEFRTSDNYQMAGASDWRSYSTDSDIQPNEEYLELMSEFGGPYTTDDALIVSTLPSGVSLDATDSNGIGEVVYWSRESLYSGITATSELQSTYLTADISSTRKGDVLEMAVIHSLDYDDTVTEDIKRVQEPFKHLVRINEPNTLQTVYWNISDWEEGTRNIDYIRAIGFKVMEGSKGNFSATIEKLRLFNLSDQSSGNITSGVPFLANNNSKYLQYRIILSTTDNDTLPSVTGISFNYNLRKTIIPNSYMRHNKCLDSGTITFPIRSGLEVNY
jgi:hypothetical protein